MVVFGLLLIIYPIIRSLSSDTWSVKASILALRAASMGFGVPFSLALLWVFDPAPFAAAGDAGPRFPFLPPGSAHPLLLPLDCDCDLALPPPLGLK